VPGKPGLFPSTLDPLSPFPPLLGLHSGPPFPFSPSPIEQHTVLFALSHYRHSLSFFVQDHGYFLPSQSGTSSCPRFTSGFFQRVTNPVFLRCQAAVLFFFFRLTPFDASRPLTFDDSFFQAHFSPLLSSPHSYSSPSSWWNWYPSQ